MPPARRFLRHTAINRPVRAALCEAVYSTVPQPSLMDPKPNQGNFGLCVDLLVGGIDGHLDTFVDVAITCPTAHIFLEGSQVFHGEAVYTIFQQKYLECAEAIRAPHLD